MGLIDKTPFADIVAKRAELDELLRKTGQEQIAPIFSEFFARHPQIKALRWSQYTPYFNDGDECVFHVYDLFYSVGADEGGDYDDGFHYPPSKAIKSSYNEEDPIWEVANYEQAISDMKEIANEILGNEEAMRAVFGDHVRVVVTADGFDVQDYEHD